MGLEKMFGVLSKSTIIFVTITALLLLVFRRYEKSYYFDPHVICQTPTTIYKNTAFCASLPRLIKKNEESIALFTINGLGVFRHSQIKYASYFDVSVGSVIIGNKPKSHDFGKLVILANEIKSRMSEFECVVYLDREIQSIDEKRILKNCASRKNMIARSGKTYYISIADKDKFLEIVPNILEEGREKNDGAYISEHKEWFDWDDGDIKLSVICYDYVARRRQCTNGTTSSRGNKTIFITSFLLIYMLFRNLRCTLTGQLPLNVFELMHIRTGLDITLIEFFSIALLDLFIELRIDETHMREITTRNGGFLMPVIHGEFNYYFSKKLDLFFTTSSFASSLEQSFLVLLFLELLIAVTGNVTGYKIYTSTDIVNRFKTRRPEINGTKMGLICSQSKDSLFSKVKIDAVI